MDDQEARKRLTDVLGDLRLRRITQSNSFTHAPSPGMLERLQGDVDALLMIVEALADVLLEHDA